MTTAIEIKCPNSPTGNHILGEPFDIKDGVGIAKCKYCPFERKVITNPFAIKDPSLRKWAFNEHYSGASQIVLGKTRRRKKVAIETSEKKGESVTAANSSGLPGGGAEAGTPIAQEAAPLRFSPEEKRRIAQQAKRDGIKKTAEKLGIPWTLIRGWVGGYCRKPKTPAKSIQQEQPPGEKQKGEVGLPLNLRKVPQHEMALLVRVITEALPTLPAFNENWPEPRKDKWFEIYGHLVKVGE